MKVLVTGATGQVGRALAKCMPLSVQLLATTRDQLDISDRAAVHEAVAAIEPDVIINAAAYTAVDRAESEAEKAEAANASGPRHLAEAARHLSTCRLLHISSDYVFDGCSTRPYRVDDKTNPLNVYGRTKLAGEQAVLEVLADRVVVLRTSWVYGPSGRNFLLTMLSKMKEQGVVQVVADQSGTPTAAASIATALWRLVELPRVHGILHWTDGGTTTWHGFASAIAEDAALHGLLSRRPEVIPISTHDYPTTARRPMNSVLDATDSELQLGLQQMYWRRSLELTLSELRSPDG